MRKVLMFTFIIFFFTLSESNAADNQSVKRKVYTSKRKKHSKVKKQLAIVNYKSDSFELPDCLTTTWAKQESCCNYSVNRSDSVASNGKYSVRFELRQNDEVIQNGMRSELIWNYEKSPNIERWYSFDIFLPQSFIVDPAPEILAQWHEVNDADLGEKPRTPPLSLRIEGNRWKIWSLWATNPVNTDQTISGKQKFDMGEFKTNQWTHFVFHVKFSYKEDGLLEVWENGSQLVDYKGPNYYNDEKGPFFKIGIYKPSWLKKNMLKSKMVSPDDRRVLFYDNIKVGNEKCNLQSILQ